MSKPKEYQWYSKKLQWKAMWSDRITFGGLVASLVMMWAIKNSQWAFVLLIIGLGAGIYGYRLKGEDKKLKRRANQQQVKTIILPTEDLKK